MREERKEKPFRLALKTITSLPTAGELKACMTHTDRTQIIQGFRFNSCIAPNILEAF